MKYKFGGFYLHLSEKNLVWHAMGQRSWSYFDRHLFLYQFLPISKLFLTSLKRFIQIINSKIVELVWWQFGNSDVISMLYDDIIPFYGPHEWKYFGPHSHTAPKELEKRRFQSENTSNVLRPNSAGGNYKSNNYWTFAFEENSVRKIIWFYDTIVFETLRFLNVKRKPKGLKFILL